MKVYAEGLGRKKTPEAECEPPWHIADAPEESINNRGGLFCPLASSDDQLLSAAQEGDGRAFDELCKRHSSGAKRAIARIVQNRDDAEDALQDTLLKAFTHMAGFRRSCAFSTWLTTIATNTALMMLRKRRSAKEISPVTNSSHDSSHALVEYPDHALGPEGLYCKRQLIRLVRREVKKLKPSIRSVIGHYYSSDCTVEESAKALSISVAAAKSRLVRGRNALRQSFNSHGVLYTDL